MDETKKLREIYSTLLERGWIVRAASRGIVGPMIPEEGYTDKVIADLRSGNGSARNAYSGGKEVNVAIPADCWPMIEADPRDRLAMTQSPGYTGQNYFEMAADMVLFAQAGILEPETIGDSTELYYWKPNPELADLFPEDEAIFNAVFRYQLSGVGSRNPETDQDVIAIDDRLMAAYR